MIIEAESTNQEHYLNSKVVFKHVLTLLQLTSFCPSMPAYKKLN